MWSLQYLDITLQILKNVSFYLIMTSGKNFSTLYTLYKFKSYWFLATRDLKRWWDDVTVTGS